MPRDLLAEQPRKQPRDLLAEVPERGDTGGLAFLNRGIANVLGAPVDAMGHVVNTAFGDVAKAAGQEYEPVTPFGGSESIGRGMEALGVRVSEPGQQPESLTEHVGRGAGEAAGSLVPFLGGARMAQTGARAGSLTQRIGQALMDPFVSAPRRALASEATAGVGMGAGGDVGERLSGNDSPYARIAGELVGGIAGGMGPSAVARAAQALPVTGTAIRGAKKAIVPFTEAGARERARDRIRGVSEDPEMARLLLDEPNPGGVSPATQTGDEGIMGLERSVRQSDPAINKSMREQETEANSALREMMREPGAGADIRQSQDFIGSRLDNLTRRMDERVRQAGQKAQERIARLSPQRKASESSMIVREELDTALKAARQEEDRLWGAIPQEAEVGTTNARSTYQRIFRDTSRAQRDDIPSKARTLLDRDQSNEAFSDTETVREMHGLYSAMREDARKARAYGDMNKARIADGVADAIIEDLGAVAGRVDSEAGAALREAIDYSRHVKERFRQGSVGRIMGHAVEGGQSLAPERTLDTAIGAGGTRGAVSADEIRRAAGAQGDEGMQDYLRSRFQDATVRNGQFDPQRAQSFVRQNAELLDRFPALKRQMQDAEQAQSLAQRTERRVSGRAQALRDPKQSRAAQFLNAPVDQEIQTVLRSRDPGAAARELRRQASKDPSGDALRGLKGGVVDFLMGRSKAGGFDETGEAFISGRAMQNMLRDRRFGDMARGLLSDDELTRLERIGREFQKMETSRSAAGAGQVMDDVPNSIISFLARTIAARSGAQMGQGTSGASLLTAGFASRRMQGLLESLTNDRAEALIREAVTGDRDLFRMLLSESAPKSDQAANRLVETLAALSGGAVGEREQQAQ